MLSLVTQIRQQLMILFLSNQTSGCIGMILFFFKKNTLHFIKAFLHVFFFNLCIIIIRYKPLWPTSITFVIIGYKLFTAYIHHLCLQQYHRWHCFLLWANSNKPPVQWKCLILLLFDPAFCFQHTIGQDPARKQDYIQMHSKLLENKSIFNHRISYHITRVYTGPQTTLYTITQIHQKIKLYINTQYPIQKKAIYKWTVPHQ